jgi:hypothetical protein
MLGSAHRGPWLLTSAALILAAGIGGTAHPARAACARGPCATPDPVTYLPGTPDVVVTNFGLLYPAPAASAWELVCDDMFGVPPATHVRRAPDGRLYAAGQYGLYLSSDGCSWTTGGGELAGKIVFDVAFDPKVAGRVWVLAEITRALFRSDDGGATFRRVFSFPANLTLERLVVAPSDGQRLYVLGRGRDVITPVFVSTDGGGSFTDFDLAARATVPPRAVLDFVSFAPDDPAVIYFTVLDAAGDQLWKTSNGGQTVAPVLTLSQNDAFGGLAFGDSSRQLYVGGSDLFADTGQPAGRLYVSQDGGATWQPPLPSGPKGPRYRCLASSGGKLYACGAGETVGDEFMVGVSSDRGHTWTPITRLADVAGARSCVKARCLPTETWLCQTYGQCAPGLDAGTPAPADAGADAPACVGTACVESQGCGCQLGGRDARTAGSAATLLALLATAAVRRRRRGTPG